jgi:pyruvate dehydrogenase E1 component alpha subunit
MDAQQLRDFERKVAKLYEQGHIKAPVHLRDGNEDKLIEIFEDVKSTDVVYCTWASHLHALLKGVPEKEVMAAILEGRSITLHFPYHNFYSSAIVGGIAPIATGHAWALKEAGVKERVYAFLGDMAFLTGIADESIRYSFNFDLPITWVVEDNGKSVCTDTVKTWGQDCYWKFVSFEQLARYKQTNILYYRYETTYPHAGTGTFVHF